MLTEDLYAHAEERGDQTAVVYGEEHVSYAELLERVERLAEGLAASGIEAGDPVALLLPNSTEFVVSFLAITGLGAVAVALNPQFKQEELAFYFRTSRVRAAIGDEAGTAVAQRIADGWDDSVRLVTTGPAGGRALSFERLLEQHAGARLDARTADEDFLYLYSSGSTGRPKRVARTHGQCWAEADSYMRTMAITPADRLFCAIPLFHTYGLGNCLTTMARTGSTLVIMRDPNPFVLNRGRALELLERQRVTIFPGVPFNFRLLADAPEAADLSSLRLSFSAGSALPRPTFQAFLDRFGIAVRQLYGSTEAGVMTINVDPDPVGTAASVGTPAVGVDVIAVDDAGVAVPAGEEGELAVSGPSITRGYSDLEEASRETFRDGRYYTGDLGRLDAYGRVFITGRKKLFIEVAGHKVDPVEVQDVLEGHPKVREAVVVGVKGKVEGEEIVKAAVVLAGDCEQRELITLCQKRLANFKVPQIFEFREEIPKSPLGKVLRKYLIE
jgi:long-chain acyl-CoA synthetase